MILSRKWLNEFVEINENNAFDHLQLHFQEQYLAGAGIQ